MYTNSPITTPVSAAASNGAPPGLKFTEAPKPLIDIPDVWLWVLAIAAVLLVVALAFLLIRYWRKQRAVIKLPPPIPPHVRARRALDQALALIGEPEPFSVAVSGAIRTYLEERFTFHAPDRTTEEFLYELQSTQLLTLEQKKSLGEFLASCDLIKFARYEPTEVELRGLHASALRLVNETEPRLVPDALQSSIPNAGGGGSPSPPPPIEVSPPATTAPPGAPAMPTAAEPAGDLAVAQPSGAGASQTP